MRAIKPDSPRNSNKENGIGCRVIIPITGDNEIIATLHRAITSTTGAIFVLVAKRLSPW